MFQLDRDELNFFKKELFVIEKKLTGFTEFLNGSFDDLIDFRNKLILSQSFDESRYLEIVEEILIVLKRFSEESDVCNLIVMFSRINSSLREVYDKLGLNELIMKYVTEFEYLGTNYNTILIEDFKYTFYYRKALDILKKQGFLNFMNFITLDDKLKRYSHYKWVVKSIFSSFLDMNLFSKDEKKELIRLLPNELTDKFKRKLI